MKVQQLETAESGCFQCPFYFFLVKNHGQLAACHQVVIREIQSSLLFKILHNSPEVQRHQVAGILLYFLQVGENTVLTYFMCNKRYWQIPDGRGIVLVKAGRLIVEDTLSPHPTMLCPLGNPEIIIRFRPTAVSLFKCERSSHVKATVIPLPDTGEQAVQHFEIAL
ncbi:hypothetical protein SDC9_191526 [bioreactor metagenome]|uniref:Uncharacterized protein n=1 Tax=bioreactor metagenome TaxID=1076179 RepID=A0A645HY44_9ZZZZ